MKIAVIGATGQTGQYVVQQGLERGYEMVALVRSPGKMEVKHDNLQVLKSDVVSKDSLEEGTKGCNALISVLGEVMADSCKSATAAMRVNGISRYIVCTAVGTRASPGEKWYYGLMRFFGKKVMNSHRDTEDYLQGECSDLKWTVVKPPVLSMQPLDSRPLIAEEGQLIRNASGKVPRANLAKFMLDQLTDTKWENKYVAVDLPK